VKRREFITLIGGAAAAWPLAARAQQPVPRRVYRIGSISLAVGPSTPDEGFRKGLHDLGYREGYDIIFISRWAAGNQGRLGGLVEELLSLDVDVIVSGTTEAILAVRRINQTIPIVMTTTSDPIGSGLIASLARPGGNTTDVTQFSTDLVGKRAEILHELVPTIKQLAVLAYWPHPPTEQLFREAEDAAKALGLKLQLLKAGGFDEIESAFEAMARERADGVIVQSNAVWNRHLGQVAHLANKRRLPAIHESADFPRAGGLISYGPDRYDLGRRAAIYVDRIFKGAKSPDLPVEQPVKFEMVINRGTANTIGITIPQSIEVRADEVIE
jgi:putative ABC transport system substrate-binding protein